MVVLIWLSVYKVNPLIFTELNFWLDLGFRAETQFDQRPALVNKDAGALVKSRGEEPAAFERSEVAGSDRARLDRSRPTPRRTAAVGVRGESGDAHGGGDEQGGGTTSAGGEARGARGQCWEQYAQHQQWRERERERREWR